MLKIDMLVQRMVFNKPGAVFGVEYLTNDPRNGDEPVWTEDRVAAKVFTDEEIEHKDRNGKVEHIEFKNPTWQICNYLREKYKEQHCHAFVLGQFNPKNLNDPRHKFPQQMELLESKKETPDENKYWFQKGQYE